MARKTVGYTPFQDQKPGTSGLRKKTRVFMQSGYLECFIQAIFNAVDATGKILVIGGDGRFFNQEAIEVILRIAAANEVSRVIVGQGGHLSTPAASNLIRQRGADGGIILSASHNPGGIDADFGVKYNIANGGPAPEAITAKIFAESCKVNEVHSWDGGEVDLETLGEYHLGPMMVEVVDPVKDYVKHMRKLFDFNAIRALFSDGFTVRFDAMHAITGPYAKTILAELGAPESSVMNGTPSETFGGGHPDPNPTWAKPLVDLAMSDEAPDFAAASDGDGDRNMILGRGIYVSPSDSLAVLVANAHLVPAYAQGLSGVARSMPTSQACDYVAHALGIARFQTPTGWKFFGNLMDAGRVTICGEESAGTGSYHIREKDGLWAILFWLNILAVRRQSVAQIMTEHWATYGRSYHARHDFEGLDKTKAEAMMAALESRLSKLPRQIIQGLTIVGADQFQYTDPVDGSVSVNQGIQVFFTNKARAVFRLSGTGTEGATLRMYLERYEPPEGALDLDVGEALTQVAAAAREICDLESHTGRDTPDVVT